MTPDEIKTLRRSLPSWSGRRAYPTQSEFGHLLGLEGPNVDRIVRRWEDGTREPTEPLRRLMWLLHRRPGIVSDLRAIADRAA